MIDAGEYAPALAVLDGLNAFVSELVSQITEKSGDAFSFCVGLLGSMLPYRYGKIVEKTNSIAAAEKAMDCAERALELERSVNTIRNASRSRRALAGCYIRKNDLMEALTHLNRAVEIDPSYDNAWWLLANVFQEIGEAQHSIRCCVRAAELGHAEAREVMASYLAARNRQ
jgi:tetratricopeptide (TPR) repeat protein